MNFVDFDSLPAGFPLESDATLGFFQRNHQDAITAVAKIAGSDNVIISGCVISGSTMSSGWVLVSGELLFFEGGTIQSQFVIEETITQKANQDGTLVDRYFVRKAKFGSGSGAIDFSDLKRYTDIAGVVDMIREVVRLGDGENWVILKGIALTGVTMSTGLVLYQDRILKPASFNDGNPIDGDNPLYLKPDGQWSRSLTAGDWRYPLDQGRRFENIIRRYSHPIGSILWVVTTAIDAGDFSSGLGTRQWIGWAIADGGFGTVNLSGAISGLTAVQRIN